MIYLILFSSFFLTANAKTVNRQAYKVCQTNEEAYWNGSSAQCCDATTHKLVKNYKNGVGEDGYACCEIKKDTSSQHNWTIVGAVNSNCCGGYFNQDESGSEASDYIYSQKQDYQIRKNGGVYYCGEEFTLTIERPLSNEKVIHEEYYESDTKYCIKELFYQFYYSDIPSESGYCLSSDKGDPKYGEPVLNDL